MELRNCLDILCSLNAHAHSKNHTTRTRGIRSSKGHVFPRWGGGGGWRVSIYIYQFIQDRSFFIQNTVIQDWSFFIQILLISAPFQSRWVCQDACALDWSVPQRCCTLFDTREFELLGCRREGVWDGRDRKLFSSFCIKTVQRLIFLWSSK